jgi:hypothetical protein
VLARDYWKAVTVDRSDLLDRFQAVLRSAEARFCVIGGQGVNAYADPVVSLDLDVVVAITDVPRVLEALGHGFHVEHFPHSINVSAKDSDLRVQIQTDPRYESFIDRASEREVLGLRLPVASVDDVLQGKIWAALDDTRRASKRQKDLADIARLLEAQPDLRARVPQAILDRLF